ncbi:hypothetical protein DIPPA_33065 [Diplonema papillatum]|nr:hypothetical protein DIPPA_33065 [Diplonema papillatum]
MSLEGQWDDVPGDGAEFDFAAAAQGSIVEEEKKKMKAGQAPAADAPARKQAAYNKQKGFFDRLAEAPMTEGDETLQDWEGGGE